MKNRQQTELFRNLGTFAALVVMILISMILLTLVAIMLPGVMGVIPVVIGFFLMGLFHYVTWGRLLSRSPLDDVEEGE